MKYLVEQREKKYPIKLVIQLNQFNPIEEKGNMSKVNNFYPLLKTLVKTSVVYMDKKSFLTAQKNLLEIILRRHQKEKFRKKQRKQLI